MSKFFVRLLDDNNSNSTAWDKVWSDVRCREWVIPDYFEIQCHHWRQPVFIFCSGISIYRGWSEKQGDQPKPKLQ